MLAGPRVGAARTALEFADAGEREAAVAEALIPLAVDAALLGADGLRELALAVVKATAKPNAVLEAALSELDRATEALGQGDASGARIDEARLRELAKSLLTGGAAALPAVPAAPTVAPFAAASAEDPDSIWQPSLAEDMLAAFLDECAERTDSLAERLLRLEQNASDKEL